MDTQPAGIELQTVSSPNSQTGDEERLIDSLPPIEGKEAWIFLAGSFVVEAVCLGGAFSFSIFQNYLMRSPESPLPHSSSVTISAIGTVLLAMLYIGPFGIRPVLARYPDKARILSFASLVLAVISMVIASFLKNAIALVIFVGLLHGLGTGIATTPYIIWLPQWFNKRRGLANGVAFAGAGTGGLIFPFIFTPTLEKLGFAWTMRIWAGIILIIGGAGLCFVKPRLPVVRPVRTEREHGVSAFEAIKKEFAYVWTPLWMLNASLTFLASAGLFAISFYLATYCSSLGLSSVATSGTVSAFNLAGLLGEISIGYACDKIAYPIVIFSIGAVGTLSTFLLFGLGHSLPSVLIFGLVFGWAAGSFCATWSASCLDIARLRKIPVDTVIISLIFVRGIAALVGPLIAAALYQPDKRMLETLFGSFGFGPLIEFVGTCMLGVAVIASVTGFTRKSIFSKIDVRSLVETH